jgi:hypothetical protein
LRKLRKFGQLTARPWRLWLVLDVFILIAAPYRMTSRLFAPVKHRVKTKFLASVPVAASAGLRRDNLDRMPARGLSHYFLYFHCLPGGLRVGLHLALSPTLFTCQIERLTTIFLVSP